MTILIVAIVAGLFLAYANGANDNFKGVATLFGSGVTGYRSAIVWGTVTTTLGSLAALVLARGLLAAFSGKGLVPERVLGIPHFPLAVGLAAGATVMLASRFGFPISTTHALVGALVGTGLLASNTGINLAKVSTTFLVPLLAGPILAVGGALLVYPALRSARERLGLRRESCVCVGTQVVSLVPVGVSPEHALSLYTASLPATSITTGMTPMCLDRYHGEVFGIEAGPALDRAHYLSAGVVSFARGLNDTPKIAAILVAGAAVSPAAGMVAVALLMALGGLLNARRIAETMGHRVTVMNAGQGFAANLVTGALVIAASWKGLPVSMTHVSCGALFGIGAVTGQARWKTIAQILVAWVTTLPVAAILGAVFFLILQQIHPVP